ncbi:MAG TPA: hypothetical protein PKJ53_05440, partial [Spirochaetales bacterium]|nr:hypothetical protein [Spirochaetales bacterium]
SGISTGRKDTRECWLVQYARRLTAFSQLTLPKRSGRWLSRVTRNLVLGAAHDRQFIYLGGVGFGFEALVSFVIKHVEAAWQVSLELSIVTQ